MSRTVTGTFFPTVLLRTRIAGHEAVNEQLMPEIERIRANTTSGPSGAWASPVYTTFTTDAELHRRDAFRALAEIVLEEILAFAEHKSVDIDAQPIAIDRCWLNVLGRGDSIDVHNHPGSFYTAVYFVQAPPHGTRLILYHPAKDTGFSMPVTKDTKLNQEGHEVRPEHGELVVFESHVTHSFKVHESDEEHVNLVFTAAPGMTTN